MAEMVYLQLAESVLAEKRKVLIRDVSKVVSDNLDLKNKIEKIELMNFSTSSKEQQVISILDIIEEIKKNCDGELCIQNLGQPDVVVYYKAFDPSDRIKQKFKFIFLCLIAFFGAGFSIISYNSDDPNCNAESTQDFVTTAAIGYASPISSLAITSSRLHREMISPASISRAA